MLTAVGCQGRRQRLLDAIGGDLDVLIVADPQYLVYLANFYPSPFVFRTVNSGAFLLIDRQGRSVLVGDSFLKLYAEDACCDEKVLPVWYRGVESAPERRGQLLATTLEQLRAMPGKRIGYQAGHVPAGLIDALRQERGDVTLVDLTPTLHEMKRRKDPDEVAVMRQAIRAAEAGFAAGLADVRPGMTELDVFSLVETAVQSAAGQQVQVYGDFVSGDRTGGGGGPPSLRTVDTGDLVLLDFSAIVHGYRGDFANTFACGRAPTDHQRQLYQACLAALHAAEEILAPGVAGRDVYQAVWKSFDEHGLAAQFTSHAGHGIGLGHPDPPYFVRESTDTIVEGDIVAVEPGVYFKGEFGMRFERNYLITADGCETLSHHALQIEQKLFS